MKDSAVVISEPGQNVALLVKEILKSQRCETAMITPDTTEALACLTKGDANVIVVDDTPNRPAPMLLRRLLCDPVAPITPILIVLSEHNKEEANSMATLGRPMIVYKPLSPGRFAPGFKTLMKVWGKPPFTDIRKAAVLFAQGYNEQGLQVLTTLNQNPKAQSIIAPTVSLLLRRAGNLQVAEKILLAALKRTPRDLGVIMSLSDFYLHAAMPQTAQRLMKSVETAYGDCMASYTDKLQASLMLNELDKATEVLRHMQAKSLFTDEVKDHLGKILYTEGRIDEFLKVVESDSLAQRISNAWGKSTPQPPAVKAS